MANDPKIKYDIEAAVSGESEVNRLAGALDGLADSLEGDIKTQAQASAEALRELGKQNAAIDAFVNLKREGRDVANRLRDAQQAAEKLGAELAQTEKPTRAQTGALQKLYDEIKVGTRNVETNNLSMVQARATLDQYGIATTSLGATQNTLRAALVQARTEAEKMVPALEGVAKQSTEAKTSIANAAKVMDESFRVLGVQSVRSLESEVKKLQTALAQIKANADILPADKRAAVTAFNAEIARLKVQAHGAGDGMQVLETSATRTGNALAEAGHKAVAWGAALGGLGAIKSVAADVINTGAQFETLRVRLENLLGGTQQAAEAFDMIKKLASTTPFEVTALTESFVKLTAMGMKPTESQMRSLSDVAANLGGGTEVLTGVTTALGQAWAKSKLQGEEINQLAERGVPVWDALTQATGRTVPELQRMSEAGLLGRDVILKLIDALGQQNMGASAKLMATYSGAVSNAKDAMAEFYDLVSQSGVLDFLTRKLQELLAEFERMKDTGELEAKAKALADGFITVASAVEQAAKVIAFLGPALLKLGEVMLAMKIASFSQSLYAIGAAALSSAAGVTTLGTASAAAAVKMDVAAVAGARVAGVLRLLRSLTGIGLVIGAAEMAIEFMRAKNAAEAGDAAITKMMTERPTNGPKKAGQEAAESLAGVPQKADDARAAFDRMIAKGDSAAEAINKIGKDFDLSTSPGIRDAATVLDGLVVDGKLTAEQFNKSWADSLKGIDLKDFEARARQAFDSSNEGALRLQGVLDASLRESIRRTGLDFEVISGGMSKASQSAINDTEAMIKGLDRLKAQGVDTGRALTASLGKGIETADSQKAIEAVRLQIEAVRKVLGDKVADGLLDQAKLKAEQLTDALEKAKPGVDSLREAMKLLGVVSEETLKNTADKSRLAYEKMRASGTASARELSDGFKKMATDVIAANGGMATEALKVEAAMRGMSIQTDATGKAIVKSMEGGAKSIQTVEDAYRQLGVKSPEDLKKIAAANEAAWNKIKDDSGSSVETLKKAFSTYAQSALDAAVGIGNEQYNITKGVLETEAALKGLTVEFDKNGKVIVKGQGEAQDALEKTRDAVDSVTAALETQNAAQEKVIAAQEKEVQLAERKKALEDKKNRVDSEGFQLDNTGKRMQVNTPTERSIFENAKSQGLTEAQALQLVREFLPTANQRGGMSRLSGENWGTDLQKAIDRLVLQNAADKAGTDTRGVPKQTPAGATPAKNYTVTINTGTGPITASFDSDSQAQAFIKVLQGSKASAGY